MDLKLTDEEISAKLANLGENATYGNGLRAIADAQLKKAVEEIEKAVVYQDMVEGSTVVMMAYDWMVIKQEAGIEEVKP